MIAALSVGQLVMTECSCTFVLGVSEWHNAVGQSARVWLLLLVVSVVPWSILAKSFENAPWQVLKTPQACHC
jgi:hypothetical protein